MSGKSVDEVLRAWRDAPLSVPEADPGEERRARMVTALEDAIGDAAAERGRRRSRARWQWGLSAAAVLALAVGGAWRVMSPGSAAIEPSAVASGSRVEVQGEVRLVRPGGEAIAVVGGSDVDWGDAVQTGSSGRAVLHLASGPTVEIDASSELRVAEEGVPEMPLALARGKATFSVPPLQAGSRFVVRTPSAEVTVHGTRFSVTVEAPSAEGAVGVTVVEVFEGTVGVRATGDETLLPAGRRWSSRSGATAELGSAAVDSPPPDGASASPAPGSTSATPSPNATPPPPASDLAAQNALFQSALAAKQRGDERAVVQILGDLLVRWPDSPLAAEATRERDAAQARLSAKQ